jgi:hypothetical protein
MEDNADAVQWFYRTNTQSFLWAFHGWLCIGLRRIVSLTRSKDFIKLDCKDDSSERKQIEIAIKAVKKSFVNEFLAISIANLFSETTTFGSN